MTVTSIPTKFSQGLRQKDIANARVNVESGLRFPGNNNGYITSPFAGNNIVVNNGVNWSCSFLCTKEVNDAQNIWMSGGTSGIDIILQRGSGTQINGFEIRIILRGAPSFDQVFSLNPDVANYNIIGPWHHIVVTHDTGNNLRFYLNGRLASTGVSTALGYAMNQDMFIGRNSFSSALDHEGIINNLTWFTKELTQREISYMWANGGLVPESAHNACVAHYALTHRYAPLTGPNRVLDVVEQYNYAKGAALAANHGTMISYTNADVGATDPVTNTAFKDFYKKATPFWGYFKQEYQVSNGQFQLTGVNLTSANKLMIYEGTMDRNGVALIANTSIAGLRNGGAALDFSLGVSDAGGLASINFRMNAATVLATTPSVQIDNVNFRCVCYHNFTTNDWVFVIRIGGQVFQFSGNHVPGNPAFSANSWRVGRYQTGTAGHLNYFRELTLASPASLTVAQAIDLLNYDYSGIVPLAQVHADDIEGDIIDLQGNTIGWLSNDDPPARVLGEGAWVEDHSLLPQPTLALQLDGSLTQKLELPNFVGSIPDRSAPGAGWTFIQGFALDTDRNFVQFVDWLWGKRDLVTANEIIGVFGSSGSTKSLNILHQNNASGSRQDFQTPDLTNWNTDGISIVAYRLKPDNYSADPLAWTGEWYLNGALISTHQSSQQDPPDFADVTGSFFLWGERFGARTLANASVFYSAIWQRALTPKEIIRITNNGIIRNPSIAMQKDLELYVNYNAPFDNGGTPEFRDLSPNNHQIIANGFANLAAVQAAQVNINTLR